MSDIDNKQILQEIMGTFIPNTPPPLIRPNYHNPGDAGRRADNYNPRNIGLNLSYCNQLEGWQRNVVDTLAGQMGGTARDQYIIARPGGGKTLPIICYWTQHMLGLNTMAIQNQNINPGLDILFANDNNVRINSSKLIFLVPVIVLAHQTAMEIRKHLATLMLQVYNQAPDSCMQHFRLPRFREYRIGLFRDNITDLEAQIARLNNLPNISADRNSIPRVQDALNTARKNLRDAVERCMSDMINEMVWTQTAQTNQKTDFDRALVFVSIYESAPKLINRIRNLRLTVIDEAHLIQESGIKNDDNQRAYQIMSSLFTILKSLRNDVTNNRLVMLSGTINPKSARNITTYFNDCFSRNFPVPTSAPLEASNRSNLAVIVNDNLNNDSSLVKYISRNVSQRDWGQLYIIFSTMKIAQLARECVDKIGLRNTENLSPAGYEPTNVFSGLGQARQNRSDINLGDISGRMSIPKEMMLQVSNITNPLLRQCVLRGVGFICRSAPDENSVNKEVNLNDQDKLIVSKLFRERKISVLLATDAVGIGVNIDVKDLYIPEVKKFNSGLGTKAYVSLRDLSQILNRAGRGATPIASIQTSRDNVEMVSNALFANPEDLPNVSELRRKSFINPCDSKSFMNLFNSLF